MKKRIKRKNNVLIYKTDKYKLKIRLEWLCSLITEFN